MVNEITNETSEEKILFAAKKVFLLKGLAGAKMQDIANEAGINKALLHYYFRNKEKLFEVIFNEALNDFFPKIEEIISADIPLFEKIEKFCKEYIEMLLQNSFLPLFILTEVSKQPEQFKEKFLKNMNNPFIKFVKQIEYEEKCGKIKEIGPENVFMNMLSMCIFPFVAKRMWMMVTGTNEMDFLQLMEQRKTEVPKFIIDSIKI